MKNIKSVQDVQSVPEDEHIWTINFKDETCPFCGTHLHYKIVQGHHGTDRLYDKCPCEVAKAAEAHNKRVREIRHEAWLRCRKAEEKARQENLKQKKA